MLKAKHKIRSILLVCLAMLATMILGLGSLFSMSKSTASAETTEIVFEFGADDSSKTNEGSQDGSSASSYTETVSGYTLTLTGMSKVYKGSYDAKGNACLKLGTGSAAGKFSFTVPDDVTSVIIKVAGYKSNIGKISINDGSTQTINTYSANGAYTDVSVDTSTNKTTSFKTVNGGYRVKITSITFIIPGNDEPESSEPACDHANKTETSRTNATCEADGEIVYNCPDCGETITETIEKLGHNYSATDNIPNNDGTHQYIQTCPNEGCETPEKTTTQDCTSNGEYTYPSYEGKSHQKVSACIYCKAAINETEDCTFERAVDAPIYTCSLCGNSYEAEENTVSFNVPNGIDEVESISIAAGYSIELPEAETIEGYTFVGWVEVVLNEKTEEAPEYLTAGTEYTVTADTTFYALYSYAEGTGAYTLVTDASTLAVGKEIVIVASDSDYAIGTNQANNNRTAVAITKSNDTVTWTTDVQVITLEEGLATGTWAFHVTGGTGTNATNGYLYATATGNHLRTQTSITNNSSWNISITAAGIATIKANVLSGQNWLRKNSSSALFACYVSDQNDVSIYMKDGATYYVTEFNTCAHTNTNEVIKKATCTESGSRTVTCLDCESQIEAEILPATGHNFVDGICQNCGKQDPASIVYDGYYYLSINDKYLSEKDGNYYKLVDFTPGETVDVNHVVYFVKNGETYNMYHLTKGLFASSINLETQEDYTVHITNNDGKILSHNTGYTTYQRLGFYATSSSYPADIVLTKVEPANIDSASITVGENLTLNYYVTMPAYFATAQMHFTIDGETYLVDGAPAGGRYVFSFEIPPHYIAENIKAELIFNELTIAQKAEYSIKTYTDNQLAKVEGSADEKDIQLKNLLNAITNYGEAATNYKAETNTAGENVIPESVNEFSLENADGVTEFGVWFTGANVWFDNTNKIMVQISATENVTLTINGAEVEVTGTTIYTNELLPTQFDDIYTFALYYDGELMQTLTYSVNSYAYRMQTNEKIGALAIALYNYGVAAEAYNS